MKTIIIAIGGNALIHKGQKGTAKEQLENLSRPISQIVSLYRKYNIVITHGNGPQVGALMLQQDSCFEVPPMPMEVLVAMTQGQIGYMIEETFDNEFMKIGVNDPLLTTIITYVQVDEADPAFKRPTKPIGPAYPEPRDGCQKTPKGWRRVVPSPMPLKIIEHEEIRRLLSVGSIVICCGGGGIPVTKRGGHYNGIEAVIDKDFASAKLGLQIGADTLLMATDTKGVFIDFGKPTQRFIEKMSIEEAKINIEAGQFPEGSMGPKVAAAINFVESGGRLAIICHLDDILAALDGKAGTRIEK